MPTLVGLCKHFTYLVEADVDGVDIPVLADHLQVLLEHLEKRKKKKTFINCPFLPCFPVSRIK